MARTHILLFGEKVTTGSRLNKLLVGSFEVTLARSVADVTKCLQNVAIDLIVSAHAGESQWSQLCMEIQRHHPYVPMLHVMMKESVHAHLPVGFLYQKTYITLSDSEILKKARRMIYLGTTIAERNHFQMILERMNDLEGRITSLSFHSVLPRTLDFLHLETESDNVVWFPADREIATFYDQTRGLEDVSFSLRPSALDDLIRLNEQVELTVGELARLQSLQKFYCKERKEDVALLPLEKGQGCFVFVNPRNWNESVLSALRPTVQRLFFRSEEFTQMQKMNYIDDLTDLYNQRYLYRALDIEIQRAEREASPFSVLFIDADRLKQINDQHGHLVGSQLITEIGKIIRINTRSTDYAFRYGGDEYLLILVGTGQERAHAVAERIRSSVESMTFVMNGLRLNLTLSIGVACYPDHAKTAQQIVAMADKAMYDGKKKSRNIVYIAS